MVENSELLLVPAFADLPDDQIAWFISQAQELRYKAGDTYVRQGTPADANLPDSGSGSTRVLPADGFTPNEGFPRHGAGTGS